MARGFQGSETTTAVVDIHRNDDDPIFLREPGALRFTGRNEGDSDSAVVAFSTSKALGGGAGTWSITIKPTKSDREPLTQVVDDDWLDLSVRRHSKTWHLARGLVDEVRDAKVMANATSNTVTITGRDFQKVWEQTPIWFNRYSYENLGGSDALKVFGAENLAGLSVSETVHNIMFGFLEVLYGYNRANWAVPDTMPGRQGDTFAENILYRDDNIDPDPVRWAVSPSLMAPDGSLWQVGQEWSDPMFQELIADLSLFYGDTFLEDSALSATYESGPADTMMVLQLRDKPFPTMEKGMQSLWFALPTHVLQPQDIVSKDVGRGGLERFNAFFVSPQMAQELVGQAAVDLVGPLWDTRDIGIHGLRRLDITTRYVAENGNMLGLAETLRTRIRDWYCVNPYLYSGTIELGRIAPAIRVGHRIRIPGRLGRSDDETYYVENVAHSWSYGTGGRTSLGVTRGWKGRDGEYLSMLSTLTGRYSIPKIQKAGS